MIPLEVRRAETVQFVLGDGDAGNPEYLVALGPRAPVRVRPQERFGLQRVGGGPAVFFAVQPMAEPEPYHQQYGDERGPYRETAETARYHVRDCRAYQEKVTAPEDVAGSAHTLRSVRYGPITFNQRFGVNGFDIRVTLIVFFGHGV
jgi:hypothetical protein